MRVAESTLHGACFGAVCLPSSQRLNRCLLRIRDVGTLGISLARSPHSTSLLSPDLYQSQARNSPAGPRPPSSPRRLRVSN